jgi:hypothetical protein
MAFKLTYSDGQADDYDDDTKWELEAGVLKLGREHGEWSVLISPSHWATLEVGKGKRPDKDDEDKGDTDKQDEDKGDTDKQDEGKGDTDKDDEDKS